MYNNKGSVVKALIGCILLILLVHFVFPFIKGHIPYPSPFTLSYMFSVLLMSLVVGLIVGCLILNNVYLEGRSSKKLLIFQFIALLIMSAALIIWDLTYGVLFDFNLPYQSFDYIARIAPAILGTLIGITFRSR